MKNKLSVASLTAFTYLSSAFSVFAQDKLAAGSGITIQIPTPSQGINPGANPGKVIGNAITIIFVLALLLVLVFVIIGAFQWITSGGDKEKTGKARGVITNALVGMVLLALAFLIVKVVGAIVNVDILSPGGFNIPSLDQGA